MAIINNTWIIEHLQLKGKTKEVWEADGGNYILALGEVGLELDTKKTKIGDGVKKWSELEYYTDAVLEGLINALTDRMTAVEGKVTALEGDMTQAKGDITSLQGDMTQVKSDITSHAGKIEALETKVAAIEGITTISVNPLLASE